MSTSPLVSVIIPFLNTVEFIQEAIESVLSQTYENWELFLVDDGSTDASTEIAKQNAMQVSGKVRYLEHEGHKNRGVSASRNLGISHAAGDYVAFLDADDVWLPEKLEQQVDILEAHPQAVMVYGPQKVWYSWTGKTEDIQRDFVPNLGIQPNSLINPPELLIHFLQKEGDGVVPSPSGILVRRSVLELVGGFEEDFKNIFDDMALYAKLALEAPVYVSDKCWYWYRQHPNQRCYITVQTGGYNSARLSFLNWLQEYITLRDEKNGEVWSVLQKELWPYRHQHLQRIYNRIKKSISWTTQRFLPASTRSWLRSLRDNRQFIPPVGAVRFGSLRRVQPISRQFGFDRGGCIDRYYLEKFLEKHSQDIHGHVLEIGDCSYSKKFGREKVTNIDVLHVNPGVPQATLVGDLETGEGIPANTFDCIILTQTIHVIYDFKRAISNTYTALKPGGVLLASLPGISQISRYDMERWGDYWRFTTLSAERLFGEVYPKDNLSIKAHGNVLTAIAFLHGLAADELKQKELDYLDPDYELLITVRAVKPKLKAFDS